MADGSRHGSLLSHAQTSPVDLVILEMLMDPGINGCETYEEIIKFAPGQEAIIASGYLHHVR